jgi:hypothetical protein
MCGAGAVAIETLERLEESVDLVGGYQVAGVGDGEGRLTVLGGDIDVNGTGLPVVSYGVVEKVRYEDSYQLVVT